MAFLYEKIDALREYGSSAVLPSYIPENLNPNFELRPYQKQAFENFITHFESSNRPKPTQVLFHMATGSGKTLIMAGLMLYLYKHNPGLTIHTPSHTGSSFGDWRGGLVGDGDFGVAGDFTEAAAAVDAAVDMSVAAEGDIGGVGHFAGFAAAEDIAGVGVAGGGADAAVAGDGEGDLTLNGAKGVEILVGVEDMVGVVDADRIAFRPGVGSGLAFDAGAVGTEFGIVVRLHSKAYRIHLDGGQGGGEACAIDIAVHDARGQGGGNRA